MMSIKFKRNLAKDDVQDAVIAGEPVVESGEAHAPRNEANGLFIPDANDPIEAVEDANVIEQPETAAMAEEAPASGLKAWFKPKMGARVRKAKEDQPAPSGERFEQPESGKAKGFFKRFGAKREVAEGDSFSFEAPFQLFLGYLPDVSAKDAMEYAMGVAEKYTTQMGLTHFHATKFGRGYLYEVHEGGSGRAYGPEIVKYFASKGPFVDDETVKVVIRAGTRLVEVTRMREGAEVLLLPESTLEKPSTWLKPHVKMTPAIPRRQGFLYAGIGILATGTLAALLTGSFFRLQGYAEVPKREIEQIRVDNLPHRQWERVRNQLQPGERIKALRFENGQWKAPERWDTPATPGTPSAPAAPAATAAPGSAAPAAPAPDNGPTSQNPTPVKP